MSTTYPIGYFREDYEFISHSEADYLDEYNGRFCVTPEYPNGTYAYFCTVDNNWNSAYPYCVGPTFYGIRSASKVTSITEPVTEYTPTSTSVNDKPADTKIQVYPNPANDVIILQLNKAFNGNMQVGLYTMSGQRISEVTIYQGSTLAYIDCQTLYNGTYQLIYRDATDSVIHLPVLIAH